MDIIGLNPFYFRASFKSRMRKLFFKIKRLSFMFPIFPIFEQDTILRFRHFILSQPEGRVFADMQPLSQMKVWQVYFRYARQCQCTHYATELHGLPLA